MWRKLGWFKRKAERRQISRFRLEVPLTVVTGSGQSHRGFSRDMSEGGIGGILPADLATGEEVWLRYQLPDGSQPKKVRATVEWREGNRYGFKFVEP